ncbi:hypothetical protein BL250_12570 [Erwinia sp. OLTSP20]|uniref:DUF1090 domain-containing protein n=1 Tax=unclassified Erwinia TaxID=2622719 RepID=UPI000C1A1988|nr:MULTISPECIES: DUF1090 domain-containing protein [unclassified Erwinia]PIJ50224.1 hypothetical protein BV501_09080 [Erwinia sp. OAMSP11]PIJ72061.1 hypothetical protein BK416_09980 [Erwinia sp. OLSSP12]PIJ81352.1 hypothetical protein BLD47_08805 [Erwinia sp. OLCASP19]PIJ84058.1 hypothetical protein BLD46_08385 [Erwinia sp. OLMTSP26]PIJ85757.1 hypothetical protein BLD49_09605 [Erwinia sp. OLMDSP33]
MRFTMIIAASVMMLSGVVQAADSLCQQKSDAIQHEIELAKKHNNQRRVNGLERALTEAQSNCSDKKLRDAHQEKIAAQRAKVKEREHELAKERAKGDDADKLEKRQHKLTEARSELKKLESTPW